MPARASTSSGARRYADSSAASHATTSPVVAISRSRPPSPLMSTIASKAPAPAPTRNTAGAAARARGPSPAPTPPAGATSAYDSSKRSAGPGVAIPAAAVSRAVSSSRLSSGHKHDASVTDALGTFGDVTWAPP